MSIIDIEGRILESSTGADLCCDDIIEKIKNDLHPANLLLLMTKIRKSLVFLLVMVQAKLEVYVQKLYSWQ